MLDRINSKEINASKNNISDELLADSLENRISIRDLAEFQDVQK